MRLESRWLLVEAQLYTRHDEYFTLAPTANFGRRSLSPSFLFPLFLTNYLPCSYIIQRHNGSGSGSGFFKLKKSQKRDVDPISWPSCSTLLSSALLCSVHSLLSVSPLERPCAAVVQLRSSSKRKRCGHSRRRRGKRPLVDSSRWRRRRLR